MDKKNLLDRFLSEDDYNNLSKAVAVGYKACDEYMMSSPVMSNFIVGMDQRSHLISVFVEYSLTKIDGFLYEFKLNAAKNCWHTRIQKGGLVITAHFLGRGGGNHRKFSRTAICREILSYRNLDLFEDESKEPDIQTDRCYCQLLHSGFVTPKDAILAIPTRDQLRIWTSKPLSIEEPDLESVEVVREELTIKLLSNTDEYEQNIAS